MKVVKKMILLLILLILNILICYMHPKNEVFPVFFMLFGIIYLFSTISEFTEIYFVFLLSFIVVYNVFIIVSQRSDKK